jgi:purine-nucleoside phosphorylase
MSTPHIRAEKGDIAKGVLLPGDPRRAKYIAENFLEDPVLFNDVRGMLGFTGKYKGKRLSVMGSGMGIPSASIYITELYKFFDVENIIRIGTCGSWLDEYGIGSVFLAQGCSTTSNINRKIFNGSFCPLADFSLLRTAYLKSIALGKKVKVGNMLSSDLFYPLADDPKFENWKKFGIMGVEMEGAGLYTAAMRFNKRALMICTVSDTKTGERDMTPEERETSLNDMIELALDTMWEFV